MELHIMFDHENKSGGIELKQTHREIKLHWHLPINGESELI
jgi:hypothetical protein